MSTARLRWLSAAAVVLAIFGSGMNGARADDTIKIEVLHSLSGTMAISETILKDLMLMEVADVNAHGGLLGKKIEPVVVDPASNWPLFAEKAREASDQGQGRHRILCCWTSVSRKSVLPVFEELNGVVVSIRSNMNARKLPTTSSMVARCPTTRPFRRSSIS